MGYKCLYFRNGEIIYMRRVLIINHSVANCGIYQFGKRLYDIVKKSSRVDYTYAEVNSFDEYITWQRLIDPDFTLFNWYHTTMGWLPPDLNIISRSKHYFVFHERPVRQYYDKYLFFGENCPTNGVIDSVNQVVPEKCIGLPRPLFEYRNMHPKNKIPTIGSFGFVSSWNKGFDTITTMVNREFDNAVLNLHMSWSPFCDPKKEMVYQMADKCRSLNTKPGITLNITHDLVNNTEMLDFLAKNDVNVFLYKDSPQYGLSSATDYALSVQRPIAIDGSIPFRHIIKDDININKRSLREIMSYGTAPLEEYCEKWSSDKLRSDLEELFINEQIAN